MTNKITKIITAVFATTLIVTTAFSILATASSPLPADSTTSIDLSKFCRTVGISIRKKCLGLTSPTANSVCEVLYPAQNNKGIIRKKIAEKALSSCQARVTRYIVTSTTAPITKAEQDKIDEAKSQDSAKVIPRDTPEVIAGSNNVTSAAQIFCQKYNTNIIDNKQCREMSIASPSSLCAKYAELKIEVSNSKFDNAVKANNACQTLLTSLIPDKAPAIIEALKKEIAYKTSLRSLRALCVNYYRMEKNNTLLCMNEAVKDIKNVCSRYFAISTNRSKVKASTKFNAMCSELVQKINQ